MDSDESCETRERVLESASRAAEGVGDGEGQSKHQRKAGTTHTRQASSAGYIRKMHGLSGHGVEVAAGDTWACTSGCAPSSPMVV